MLHDDRERATSFGEDPEQYDRARPSYATAMVDDLVADGPRRVVDVGCGTGIVGRLFVSRGCDVTGVEPDARMAAVAARYGIEMVVSRFEDWDAPAEPFDLLVCGQAWHWVEPAAGMAKAASVLRPGGRFAVFWNRYAHEPDVAAAFDDVYARAAPALRDDSVVLGTIAATNARDAASDAVFLTRYGFEHVEHRAYDWDHRYTRDEWVDQLQTHSDHRRAGAAVLDALLPAVGDAIDALGGAITVHHSTRLVTAVRA